MFARSLPVSIAVHLAALVLLFVVPLAAPVVLTVPASPLPPYIKAAAIPPPPGPPPPAAPNRVTPATPSLAPTVAPTAILPEVERAVAPSAITDPFGVEGALIDTGAIGDPAKTIELPPPPAPRPSGPVRLGELLVAPRKLVDVRPVYPQIARAARIEGTVVLEAVLDRGGRVTRMRVVSSSSPLLNQAAIDAVSQWQYTPSVLHGQPVEVLMTITITFKLQS